MFRFAAQNPCVLFLDELDCIATRRGAAQSGAEAETARIAITLIQELNNLPNNIVLMGATNRYDLIDEAIKRRFKPHEVKPFSFEEKFQMLQRFNESIGKMLTNKELDYIAGATENQSYAIREMIEWIAERVTQ